MDRNADSSIAATAAAILVNPERYAQTTRCRLPVQRSYIGP